MQTKSGSISATMTLNGAFLVLWLVVGIANAFGFATYTPPQGAAELVVVVVVVVNMALRYWKTREPIAKP